MNWTKFSLATVIGAVSYFFLGWLVFGIVLRDLTALPEDIRSVIEIPMEEFKMSYMIISCFMMGAVYSLICLKWANVSTFAGGLKVCAIVGLLFNLAVGFAMSSMFKMHSLDQIFVGGIGELVVSGIAGGIIGWFLGLGK